MKVKNESEVTQPCLTLCNPIDGSPPGSPILGILQARVLEWGAIAFSTEPPGKPAKHFQRQDEGGVWLVVANFLVSESFVLAAALLGQVTCKPPNKAVVILCSVAFYLHMNGRLKARAPRIGCPAYFRLYAAVFYKRRWASMTKHRPQSSKIKGKKNRSNMESDLLFSVTLVQSLLLWAFWSRSTC